MWDKIKSLLGSAAPLIGTIIGGPAGGAVAGMVASALGVENNPEAIEQAIMANPDAIVKIKQLELESKVELQRLAIRHDEIASEERKLAITKQHQTIQTELASNDPWVRRWRPTFGYAMCLAWCLLFFGVAFAMVFHAEQAAAVVNSVVALTPLFGIALAVLGINIHKRSLDKQVSAGHTPLGVIQGLKQSIQGG